MLELGHRTREMASSPSRCQMSDLLKESGRAAVLCIITKEFVTCDQTPKQCLPSCLSLPRSQSPHRYNWFKFCQMCNVSRETKLCWVVIHNLPNPTLWDRKQTQGSPLVKGDSGLEPSSPGPEPGLCPAHLLGGGHRGGEKEGS